MNSAVFKMLLVLSFIPVTVNAESSPIDASIQNALPYIQQEAQTWIDQKKCVSCHQVPFGLWSTHVAKNAGFQIDKELFETQTKWSLQFCDTNVTDKTKKRDGGGTDTTYQIILSGVSASDATVTTSLANLLTTFQKADGSFKPGGQLPGQKRPLLETTHVSTAWAALMFHDLALDEHQKTLDKAVKFTLGDFTGQTTEWMAVRALLEQEFGGQQESASLKLLLNSQHEDGGWGWDTGHPSDALATGIALYALSRSKGEFVKPVKKAHDFLIRTQTEKGHWIVPGTKQVRNNKPGATSNYWGTCWAVIGLVSTQPK